jgi:microcin C transport system ATP-binding protein
MGMDAEWGVLPAFWFGAPHERERVFIVANSDSKRLSDKPTSALDMMIQAQIVDLLRELQRKHDLTYMFISHDLKVVAALASHVMVMRAGKVVEQGEASEVFADPKSSYTRALFAAAFSLETADEGVVAE